MPAIYLPVIVMLLALIFRGVSFEFREVAKSHHRRWDYAFAGGSIVAAFSQGVILGGLLQGITVVDRRFAGGAFDWLDALRADVRRRAGRRLRASRRDLADPPYRGQPRRIFAAAGAHPPLSPCSASSRWSAYGRRSQIARIAERWFSTPNIYFLWPVPLLTALLALLVWRGLASKRERDAVPRLGRAVPALLSRAGDLELPLSRAAVDDGDCDAAAVPESQIFTLIGVVFMLPIILGYTAFVYWTFLRGPLQGYSDSSH